MGRAVRDENRGATVGSTGSRPLPQAESENGRLQNATPHHARSAVRGQKAYLVLVFVVSLAVSLVFGAGILWWQDYFATPPAGGKTEARETRMPPRLGKDVPQSSSSHGGASGSAAPSLQPGGSVSCATGGGGRSADSCPGSAPTTLPSDPPTPTSLQSVPVAEPVVKSCDGSVVVPPGNGKLSASQLQEKFETAAGRLAADVAISWYDPRQGLVSVGRDDSWTAWSTSKVPLAVAVSQAGKLGDLGQSAARAITVSDNEAADRLWQSVGENNTLRAAAINRVLREAGDAKTLVPTERKVPGFSVFGQTQWSTANQVRLAVSLPCLPGAKPVVDLMGQIVPSQRWGMGQLPEATFKGGWGPEGGKYTVRQFGWYKDASGGRVLIAMAVKAQSMQAGIAALNAMVQFLR